MNKFLFRFFLFSFFSVVALAQNIEFLAVQDFSADVVGKDKSDSNKPDKPDVFNKTKLGGFSGISFDKQSGNYFVISDDRGNVNEPRFYEFQITTTVVPKQAAAQHSIVAKPLALHFLQVDESTLSHSSKVKPVKNFSKVIDMEAVALLPWGDLLLSSEGDHNHKPRIDAQIFSVSQTGVIRKDYALPVDYLAEKSGQQKTGVQNNAGFEGLAANPNGKSFLAALEAPLMQEKTEKKVRFLEFVMPDAFVLKPGKEYFYPITELDGEIQRGVSEILFYDDNQVLVLERAVSLGSKGPEFYVEIYITALNEMYNEKSDGKGNGKTNEKSSVGLLKKRKLLDFKTLQDKIGATENFEAMTWGPELPDGGKTLIVVSDDNFKKYQRTQFLLLKVSNK